MPHGPRFSRSTSPPGMMHHQRFNPGDGETRELRFECGIRYWLVDRWKGYATIDKHLKAMPMDEDDEDHDAALP